MTRKHLGGTASRGRFSRSTTSLRRAHGRTGQRRRSRSSSSPRQSWGGFMPMDSSIRRVIGMGNCSRCMRSGTSSETDGTGILSGQTRPRVWIHDRSTDTPTLMYIISHNGTGVLNVNVRADPDSVTQLMRGSLPTLSAVTPDPEYDTVPGKVTGRGTPQVLLLAVTVAPVMVPLEVIVYLSFGWQRLSLC